MRVLATLVLYRRRPEASESLVSLRECLRAKDGDRLPEVRLLVYDNSPEAQAMPEMPVETGYVSDPANPGLAAAYGEGLRLARAAGVAWLMLLDQDTVVTRAYLAELETVLPGVPETVWAVVPKLVHARGVHSPHTLPRLRHRGVAAESAGVAGEEVSAFNSGAVVRVGAMERLGGFPAEFPMEYLDHVLFHRLQAAGGRVYVMRAALEHDLSTMRLGEAVTPARYRRVLEAEQRFYAEVGGADRWWYRLRRLKQAVAHLVKVGDKRFAWMDLRAAFGVLGKDVPL